MQSFFEYTSLQTFIYTLLHKAVYCFNIKVSFLCKATDLTVLKYTVALFSNLKCFSPLCWFSHVSIIHPPICLSVHLSIGLHADLEMESVIQDSAWVADPLNHYSLSSGRRKNPLVCCTATSPNQKLTPQLRVMCLHCVTLIRLVCVSVT